jgi:hypothetical protein
VDGLPCIQQWKSGREVSVTPNYDLAIKFQATFNLRFLAKKSKNVLLQTARLCPSNLSRHPIYVRKCVPYRVVVPSEGVTVVSWPALCVESVVLSHRSSPVSNLSVLCIV